MSMEPVASLRRRRGTPAPRTPATPGASEAAKPRKHRLLRWEELEDWQKEEESYIESGYRQVTPSVWKCIKSWAYLHNETVNTFSHFIGALLFYLLPFVLHQELRPRYASASPGDIAVFALYLFGVAVCFTLSTAFHTIMSHSKRMFGFGIQLDFQGIVILMWGASAPMVYYTFYTEPKLQKIYWSLNSVFAVLASIVTFTAVFRKPAAQPLRVGVYGSLALSTLVPIIHGLGIHGWNGQSERFPMWGIGLTLLFNSLGALAYATRFPERWWRRTFDIFGASHQIMHIMIIIAGLAFLAGMLRAFDNVHSRGVMQTRNALQMFISQYL